MNNANSRSVLGAVLLCMTLLPHLRGYVSFRSVWDDGEVPVLLQLGESETALTDGSESYDAVAEWVVARWNPFMNRTKIAPQRVPGQPFVPFNGQNNVFFADSAFGMSFNGALAVTFGFNTVGVHLSEKDIIVDSSFTWDSYRGDLNSESYDLRRVLLHEFGHFIGLGHPDDFGQFEPAIMNSFITDADALLEDDKVGVVYLYGLSREDGGVGNVDDHGGLFATASPGEVGSTLTGELSGWDRDIFAVPVSQDGALIVSSNGGDNILAAFYLEDQDFLGWGMGDDDSGGAFQAISPVAAGETVYVVVEDELGEVEGSYELQVTLTDDQLNGDTVKATLEEAQLLSLNSTFGEALNYSLDVDIYRFEIQEAGRLTVYSTGDLDLTGGLRNAEDELIESDFFSGEGLNFRIETDVLEPGTYYLEVFDFFALDTGKYQIVNSFEVLDLSGSQGARLTNLSVRTGASGSFGPLIVGFVTGGGNKELLLRAVGPSLADFGVPDHIDDPKMTFNDAGGDEIAESDDWWWEEDWSDIEDLGARLGAFELSSNLDAALIVRPEPGAYTMVAEDFRDEEGQVLVEAYDADLLGSPGTLTNLSTRAEVGLNGTFLTAGFVVAGEGNLRLLIRGIGPELANFGVSGALSNPRIEVFDSGGEVVASNDDWSNEGGELADVFSAVGAFALTEDSADAALIVELPGGVYTVQLKGEADGKGQALVEIYAIP